MNLYKLTQEALAIQHALDHPEDGDNPQDLLADALAVEGEIAETIDSLACLAREYELTGEGIKAEVKRLMEEARSASDKAERIREAIAESMRRRGVRKCPTTHFPRLSLRRNGGPCPIVIKADVMDLREPYRVATWKPDMEELRIALQDGHAPDGVEWGERGEHLAGAR